MMPLYHFSLSLSLHQDMDAGTGCCLRSRWLLCFVFATLLCSGRLAHRVSGRWSRGGRRSPIVSLEDYSGPRANPRHDPKPCPSPCSGPGPGPKPSPIRN
ncbi:hypothetical protein MUK42_04234 [Musa troglodytarum]|uniref:Uncharacterized protein n=1 Tax=Musa troglodytarum TaxID=320322 RepID=A0A9E7GC40_9LILI|nr:hypothetical protein MUK42_04234 [Musa troglodytarum]